MSRDQTQPRLALRKLGTARALSVLDEGFDRDVVAQVRVPKHRSLRLYAVDELHAFRARQAALPLNGLRMVDRATGRSRRLAGATNRTPAGVSKRRKRRLDRPMHGQPDPPPVLRVPHREGQDEPETARTLVWARSGVPARTSGDPGGDGAARRRS